MYSLFLSKRQTIFLREFEIKSRDDNDIQVGIRCFYLIVGYLLLVLSQWVCWLDSHGIIIAALHRRAAFIYNELLVNST